MSLIVHRATKCTQHLSTCHSCTPSLPVRIPVKEIEREWKILVPFDKIHSFRLYPFQFDLMLIFFGLDLIQMNGKKIKLDGIEWN